MLKNIYYAKLYTLHGFLIHIIPAGASYAKLYTLHGFLYFLVLSNPEWVTPLK
ncbi:hypothetical protein [uncultured Gammaproteobacteria bacterium]|nr:hypothetical protein [uncultured Gammaproteobacteria bacterium]